MTNLSGTTPPKPLIEYDADGSPRVWYAPSTPLKALAHAVADGASSERLTQFQLSFSATSLEVAAKLGLGTIFSASASSHGKAIFYDAVATTDYSEDAVLAGVCLYTVRRGTGVRLALSASKLKIETNLSLSMVAAQARESGAKVSYELQGIGMPPSVVASLLGALRPTGELNADSYAKLDKVLREDLPDYLADATKPLTPTDYIVAPRPVDHDELVDRARIMGFAMKQIADEKSLADALEELADHAPLDTGPNRYLVIYTYSQVTGVSDPRSDREPSAAAVQHAKTWLRV